MYVQYDNRDDDTQSDQQHGKEKVFPKERQRQRGRRNNFGNQQEEHGLRQEDADAQGNLLARVGGQVEDQHAQVRDADTRNDQIDGVEEGFAAQRDVEENVCKK